MAGQRSQLQPSCTELALTTTGGAYTKQPKLQTQCDNCSSVRRCRLNSDSCSRSSRSNLCCAARVVFRLGGARNSAFSTGCSCSSLATASASLPATQSQLCYLVACLARHPLHT